MPAVVTITPPATPATPPTTTSTSTFTSTFTSSTPSTSHHHPHAHYPSSVRTVRHLNLLHLLLDRLPSEDNAASLNHYHPTHSNSNSSRHRMILWWWVTRRHEPTLTHEEDLEWLQWLRSMNTQQPASSASSASASASDSSHYYNHRSRLAPTQLGLMLVRFRTILWTALSAGISMYALHALVQYYDPPPPHKRWNNKEDEDENEDESSRCPTSVAEEEDSHNDDHHDHHHHPNTSTCDDDDDSYYHSYYCRHWLSRLWHLHLPQHPPPPPQHPPPPPPRRRRGDDDYYYYDYDSNNIEDGEEEDDEEDMNNEEMNQDNERMMMWGTHHRTMMMARVVTSAVSALSAAAVAAASTSAHWWGWWWKDPGVVGAGAWRGVVVAAATKPTTTTTTTHDGEEGGEEEERNHAQEEDHHHHHPSSLPWSSWLSSWSFDSVEVLRRRIRKWPSAPPRWSAMTDRVTAAPPPLLLRLLLRVKDQAYTSLMMKKRRRLLQGDQDSDNDQDMILHWIKEQLPRLTWLSVYATLLGPRPVASQRLLAASLGLQLLLAAVPNTTTGDRGNIYIHNKNNDESHNHSDPSTTRRIHHHTGRSSSTWTKHDSQSERSENQPPPPPPHQPPPPLPPPVLLRHVELLVHNVSHTDLILSLELPPPLQQQQQPHGPDALSSPASCTVLPPPPPPTPTLTVAQDRVHVDDVEEESEDWIDGSLSSSSLSSSSSSLVEVRSIHHDSEHCDGKDKADNNQNNINMYEETKNTKVNNDDNDNDDHHGLCLARPRFSCFDKYSQSVWECLDPHHHKDEILYFDRYRRNEESQQLVPDASVHQTAVGVGIRCGGTGSELPAVQMHEVRVRGRDPGKATAALTSTSPTSSSSSSSSSTTTTGRIRSVLFPLLATLLPRWNESILEKQYDETTSTVKRVLILVSGVGTPRNWTHDRKGNSTYFCARIMKAFLERIDPTLIVVHIHSETNLFRYDENLVFSEQELMPIIHSYRDAHARGLAYPDEEEEEEEEEKASTVIDAAASAVGVKGMDHHVSLRTHPFAPEWRDTFHTTLSFADGSPARTYAIQASLRQYRPTYFHIWQLKTFWHESKIVNDDIEVHSFEAMETIPPVVVQSCTDPLMTRVIQEMQAFREEMVQTLRSDNDEINAFWLRKTHKPVLAVLLVQNDGHDQEPVLYRGTNMEVSMPTGSLCAERNVIGTALADQPGLRREDIKLLAVLAVPVQQSASGFVVGRESEPTTTGMRRIHSCGAWIDSTPTFSKSLRKPSFASEVSSSAAAAEDSDEWILPFPKPESLSSSAASSVCLETKESAPSTPLRPISLISKSYRKRTTVLLEKPKSQDLNPLSPCGACNEWLKKIAECNPYFKILTFTDAACNGVYITHCQD